MAFFVCVIFVSAFAVVILHDVTSKRERERMSTTAGGYLPPHKHEGGRNAMRGESNPEALPPAETDSRTRERERESGEVISDEDEYDDADEVE